MNNFLYGVVENRDDPLMLGRVQVRLIGYHSEIKAGNDDEGIGIPTEDLPWALPMQSITSAAMNGIGDTSGFNNITAITITIIVKNTLISIFLL